MLASLFNYFYIRFQGRSLSKGGDRKYPLEYSRKVCLVKKYTLHRPLERKRTNVFKKGLEERVTIGRNHSSSQQRLVQRVLVHTLKFEIPQVAYVLF